MWHVSVAFQRPKGPVPLRRWDSTKHAKASGLAIALLRGVGQGELFWKRGEIALHLRRQVSDDEIAQLPAAWLALPAIDDAG